MFICFKFNFCQLCAQNLYFAWKIGQNFNNSHSLTFFRLLSTLNDPFFGEKSLTERPYFRVLSEHPRHFQS